MRGVFFVGALIGGMAFEAAVAKDSRACGGCFHRPISPTSQSGTVVTDHRMIFSVSPMQTTLYDQIRYSGSPSDFAWVLPIHGQVSVGVSSDLLFQELDNYTHTKIVAPPDPCRCCPLPTGGTPSGSGGGGGGGSSGTSAPPPAPPTGVTVTAKQVVGPYATVQLHPNSATDTAALTSWLDANGYEIPPNISPIIAAYVEEGFDFLAMKLVPGQGVQAMRPVSVTSPGAGLSLPLRMVAAGTGPIVGITLWVVATGRYEPKNFPFFFIDPSTLVWDWSTSSSNYATLRVAQERALGYAAWQIESSFRGAAAIEYNLEMDDPSASSYDPVPASDGGAGLAAVEARAHDLNALFPLGGSWLITRMRADLSQTALATDLVLQASCDQSLLPSVYQAGEWVNGCDCGCGGQSGSIDLLEDGGTPSPSGSGSGSGPRRCGGVSAGGGSTASGPHSGCSASPSAPPRTGLLGALAALIALARHQARVRTSIRA